MGARLGPSAGYWFPRGGDLQQLLNDLTSPRLEQIHPLTGIMLQSWDSVHADRRRIQFMLGDSTRPDEPALQRDASRDALQAIRQWWARSETK